MNVVFVYHPLRKARAHLRAGGVSAHRIVHFNEQGFCLLLAFLGFEQLDAQLQLLPLVLCSSPNRVLVRGPLALVTWARIFAYEYVLHRKL